ncbi:hypothetical protein OIU74_019929 [Salix koriyanagi]|uniref:Pentatricopeptide repeat-containing protein n=1 Tax=Salix koriyanagi TaxID=2511006 RepID=A0A9Q0P5D6_9ROSI|nr:hypothetical protein OIU74_019929 [Salix koriyanagi]
MDYAERAFKQLEYKDILAWNSILSMHSKQGFPHMVVKYFGLLLNSGVWPNEFTFAIVLSSCARLDMVECGRQVHCNVVKMGFESISYCEGALIGMYAKCNLLTDARSIFDGAVELDKVSWTSMIGGYIKVGLPEEAVKVFQEMEKAGQEPDQVMSKEVMGWKLLTLDFGLLVHAEALKLGLHSNVYVGSSLVSMYAKCGKMEAAKKVFNTVDEQNVVLWNAMLGGYVQNGHAYEVIELFFNMKSCGFYPDDFTYSSILSAYMYAKSGALEDARQQFELIRNRDNVSWNVIIVGYVQEEDEVEAFHLFQRMNLLGILPDEVSLASILSACASVRGLEQGKQVHCLSVKSGQETKLYSGSS